jgi:hypothetical protein
MKVDLHMSPSMSAASRWPKARYIVRDDRTVFTLGDLPATDTRRWTMRRKAEIVEAVRGGLITVEEARARYTLTAAEFLSWQSAIQRSGTPGLNAKRGQADRRAAREAAAARAKS